MNDYIKNNLPAVCAAATVIAFLYAAWEFLIIGASAFAAVALAVAVVVALITAYRACDERGRTDAPSRVHGVRAYR